MVTVATEEELKTFVGRRADYYIRQWKPYLAAEKWGMGWNWAAFLVSTFWLGYRKMYLHLAILFAVFFVGEVTEELLYLKCLNREEVPSDLIYVNSLLCAAVCGALGNRWYYRRASRVIADARARVGQGERLMIVLRRKGDASVISMVLSMAVVTAAFYFIESWMRGSVW